MQTRPVFVFRNTNTYLKYKYCIWKSILNTIHKQSIWKVFKYFFCQSICKYFFWPIKYFSFLLQPHMNGYFFGSIIRQGRRGRLSDENFEKLIVSSQLFKLNKLSAWSWTHTSMMSVFSRIWVFGKYLKSIWAYLKTILYL